MKKKRDRYAPYKYPILAKKIIDVYGAFGEFARDLGIQPAMLSNRLYGKTPISVTDVPAWCKLLEIPAGDVTLYFCPEWGK